jgi:hypothetical protein
MTSNRKIYTYETDESEEVEVMLIVTRATIESFIGLIPQLVSREAHTMDQ